MPALRHRKRRLEPTVFGLAINRLGVDEKSRSYEAARLVMVEGKKIAEAVRICRVTRQGIYLAMNRVEQAFDDLDICIYCGQKKPAV
jgi:hypothetical protein